jgi:hypothetical protein
MRPIPPEVVATVSHTPPLALKFLMFLERASRHAETDRYPFVQGTGASVTVVVL